MQRVPAPIQAASPGRGPNIIACPDCAAIQALPPIRSGLLRCWQCRGTLEHASGRPPGAALACALTTLILLIPANLLLLITLSKAGFTSHGYLSSGLGIIWNQGWPLTAIIAGLLAIVFPFFRFALLAVALTAVLLRYRRPWVGPLFRIAEGLDLWAMPDVFLIGVAIGFSRLLEIGGASIGPGGWCFLGAALMAMLTRGTLERRRVWRIIEPENTSPGPGAFGCPACGLVVAASCDGERCRRCGVRLRRRNPAGLTSALALTIGGVLLYPVANIYPLSILKWFGGTSAHTLFSAVSKLLGANLWFLAGCVFTTSIAIPFVKLMAILWFYASVRSRSTRHLVFKTRCFRVVDELGRWSTMDVFTVVVYMPLLQFGQLASVKIGIGLPALLGVVILTMLASRAFDPRLLWDAVEPS